MSAYEPGTVAVATVRGVPNVRVMRTDGPLSSAAWATAEGKPHRLLESASVTDARPLVVIDPEDREAVERLVTSWREQTHATLGDAPMTLDAYRMQAALREFANPTPPKPETVSAHDGCHDKGWEDVDGVRYCVNCGWSEFARVMRELP